jgi:hypothetical protein
MYFAKVFRKNLDKSQLICHTLFYYIKKCIKRQIRENSYEPRR